MATSRSSSQFWSDNPDTRQIWFSLYTPQIGEESEERLRPEDRQRVVNTILELRTRYPKLRMPKGMVEVYLKPPKSPDECTFAKTTLCVSSDLDRRITPCQFGGNPDCEQCGCIASAGLDAIARHHLPGGLRVGAIFDASFGIGKAVARLSGRADRQPPPPARTAPSSASVGDA